MPLPDRYAEQIPDVDRIWQPEGYFEAQGRIWLAQAEAGCELNGTPSADQVVLIRDALRLTPDDVNYLNKATGHETNRYLRLVQKILPTEVGNSIHRGLTSSDVLDTSLALQILASLVIVREDFDQLGGSLLALALEHIDTDQIARSHGRHAIPQTFGRQVIGWYAEVNRGVERIDRARKVISFGKCSGEVGTNVFIEPELEDLILNKVGLEPDPAPTQVISRDRHAEVMALLAVNAATLARVATNIRLLSMNEIDEVQEPFDAENQQGSSAMPHKRNSELSERVVGLNHRMSSAVGEELDASLLWLERDISHSSTERFGFPDMFGSFAYTTRLARKVIDGLTVNSDRMLENMNVTYGAIYSSRLLNALIDTGKFSRTEAYELAKSLSLRAMSTRTQLLELAAGNPQISEVLTREELAELFNPKFYLRNIKVAFRRLGVVK